MYDDYGLTIYQIRCMSVEELTLLTHEELDHYINDAEQTSIDAAIVLNWLTLAKHEKTLADRETGQ